MNWLYLAWLPGYLEIAAAHVHPKDRPCRGDPVRVRRRRQHRRRLDRRPADARAAFPPVNSRKIPVIVGLLGMVGFTVVAAETSSDFIAVAGDLGGADVRRFGQRHVLGAVVRRRPGAIARPRWARSRISAAISAARWRRRSPASSSRRPAASSRRCWRPRRSGLYRHLHIWLSSAPNRLQMRNSMQSLARVP